MTFKGSLFCRQKLTPSVKTGGLSCRHVAWANARTKSGKLLQPQILNQKQGRQYEPGSKENPTAKQN